MMVCGPMPSPAVVKLTTLQLVPRVSVPRTVVPCSKATVPVGVPAPGEATVTLAVNVTDQLLP